MSIQASKHTKARPVKLPIKRLHTKSQDDSAHSNHLALGNAVPSKLASTKVSIMINRSKDSKSTHYFVLL